MAYSNGLPEVLWLLINSSVPVPQVWRSSSSLLPAAVLDEDGNLVPAEGSESETKALVHENTHVK